MTFVIRNPVHLGKVAADAFFFCDCFSIEGTAAARLPYLPGMKMKIALAALGLAAVTTLSAQAQDSEHSWSKTYAVIGRPTLNFETSDASVDIRSCGACREIRIHVELEGKKLSDYRLDVSQSGDQVHFLFKEIQHPGVHIVWRKTQTRVTVETPADLALEAKTADGNVHLSDLQGEIGLTSGDGNVTLDHLSGNLRVKSGDGQVNIANASGAIDARTSDGNLTVDGVFHAVTLHTSDGRLDVSLRNGTKLTEPSSIQSSDGGVALHLPQAFAADLNVHTSDGHVDCALPLTMDHYHSSSGDGRELHGHLNGGGVPLTIHTSDGSVKIDQL